MQKKSWWTSSKKEALTFYLLISPWIIGFVVFIAWAMVSSLFHSFTLWDVLTPARWVGLQNYSDALEDPLVWQSLKVTALYSLASVPLNLIFSMILALMLHNAIFLKRIFRTIYYLPAVIGGVPVMILWMFIFNPEIGLLNKVLGFIGIEGPTWLFDMNWALPAMIIMSLWGVGGNMIIWLAGLNNIPRYLYEAADIDGSNSFKKFLFITLPMLTPTIFFNLIMGIIGAFQTFGQAYVMTNGGPNNATLFYNLYLWKKAFSQFDMGYASALAWILFFIMLLLSILVVKSSDAWVYYEGRKK